MKRVLILSLIALFFCSPVRTVYAATTEEILNAATLSPNEYLAPDSPYYLAEYRLGFLFSRFLDENFTPEDADTLLRQVISDQTNEAMSTYQKVAALYTYIIQNTSYGYGGYGNYCSVYSVLKQHIGTCADYSYTMMAFLNYLGIKSRIVSGQTHTSSGGYTGHMWVESNINDIIYIFDPQIDDTIAGDGAIGYYRFCKTYDEVPDKYILADGY